ncbi:MAG TPA: hypothetical protein VEB21_10530 [Terriglobales bacterium]|nr:hypothetical protein [Terriglobales bacterium]
MKNLYRWLAAGSLCLGSAAYAGPMEPGQGPSSIEPGLERGTEVDQPASRDRLGAHNHVTGRIASIDRDRRLLILDTTDYGQLTLTFQPNDLLDAQIGSTVTAELGLWPGSLHEEPLRAGDAPVEPKVAKNDRAMTGSITEIDHNTGVIDVATDRGPLQLAFANRAIAPLRVGDRVTVEIDFNKATGSPEKMIE